MYIFISFFFFFGWGAGILRQWFPSNVSPSRGHFGHLWGLFGYGILKTFRGVGQRWPMSWNEQAGATVQSPILHPIGVAECLTQHPCRGKNLFIMVQILCTCFRFKIKWFMHYFNVFEINWGITVLCFVPSPKVVHHFQKSCYWHMPRLIRAISKPPLRGVAVPITRTPRTWLLPEICIIFTVSHSSFLSPLCYSWS